LGDEILVFDLQAREEMCRERLRYLEATVCMYFFFFEEDGMYVCICMFVHIWWCYVVFGLWIGF